jgi:hypothetical protein
MSNLFIGVKRIIAVDSSEFAYAEVEVDAHCMLVAQGNVGKSSLINAIRLFFLPECSMAKQAVNFGFSDSNGDMYGSETTFNHYFPSKYSFLILEYEKRGFPGPHCCQILSASGSGRLKFERMFTQLPFEQLRHLFWQAGADADGIGQRIENLSKQRVYDFIHKHDRNAVLAKEPGKVASLLYESELQHTHFSLFPLANQDPQSINSLRALIKLLFIATGKNKKPFTDAIANIIEGNKKTAQDQLGFSISAFKDQHESLKHQEHHLNAIINQQSTYQKLLKEKASFEDYLATLEQVKPATAYLQASNEHLQQELQQHAEAHSRAKDKQSTAHSNFTKLHDDLRLEKSSLKEKTRELKEAQALVHRFEQLQTEFVGQSASFITSAISDELINKQTELDVLSGNVNRAEAIATLDNQLSELERQKTKLLHAIAHTEFSLENQLSKSQLDWLHSINPALANANTGGALEEDDKDAIVAFANLFSVQASHYSFYDVDVSFAAYSKVNRQAQLDKLQQDIDALHKQRRKLGDEQQNVLHIEQSRKQIQQSINLANNDLNVLENQAYAAKRASVLSTDIDQSQHSIDALEQALSAADSLLIKSKQKVHQSDQDYQGCRARIDSNKTFLKQLTQFASLHNKWLSLLDDDVEFSGYLTDQNIMMFESSATNLERLQFAMIGGLRQFIDLKIIEDKQGIKGDAPFWHEICACFDDASEIYGNLDTQRNLLDKQIEEHNQTIGTKKEIIVQNYRVIKAFEKDINRAFSGLTINNVAAVEFEVGINKQFETLVKEFEETNLYSSQMQSDDFYTRLVAFAERFFDADDSFTLTMDKVIEAFEPRVQLLNKSGKENKKQSNSTNALIKIKLVQLLLKRLIYHNCETSFPIVHDEIANIDIGQFDWWLADLASNGFNLMAAGTHSTSPELQAKIGRRHVMDALTTALPYHAERDRVYWQGGEEFTQANFGAENAEQAALI